MKSDLRISIKDYHRNKNLKIQLQRAIFSHRQFFVRMNAHPGPRMADPFAHQIAHQHPQSLGQSRLNVSSDQIWAELIFQGWPPRFTNKIANQPPQNPRQSPLNVSSDQIWAQFIFKPPRQRGRTLARALRARQGPLNFTCASVTVRHFIRETAEDCRSAVFAFATETVGHPPLTQRPALHALDHGGQLIVSLICHTCAPRVCPHTLQILNHKDYGTRQRHRVGQVVFSQLVFVGSPKAFRKAFGHVLHSSAGAVVCPTLGYCTLPEQPKPAMFKLVRQRDCVARPGSTQQIMEVEPATHFPNSARNAIRSWE